MSVRDWVQLFVTDRTQAFLRVPDDMWANIHPHFVDQELDVTERGLELLDKQ